MLVYYKLALKVLCLGAYELIGDRTVHYRKGDGENGKTWFRSDRFFTIGAEWYATTREGSNLGPYKTRSSAEQGLVRYIVELKNKRQVTATVAKASTDVWKATNYI